MPRTARVAPGGYFDNLTVSQEQQVVPEPSTFAIWALGLLGLGLFGRRRRRS